MANPILESLGEGLVGGVRGSTPFKAPGKSQPRRLTSEPLFPRGYQPTFEEVQAKLVEMMVNPPPLPTQSQAADPEGWAAWNAHQDQSLSLQTLLDFMSPTEAPSPADDPNAWRDRVNPNETIVGQFNAQNADFQNRIALDQLSQDKAAADLDAFLGGLAESRARGGQILEGQKMRQQYGTSGGKTDFSLADLGAGFEKMAGIQGIDPNAAFLRYPGVMNVDPEGDLARIDAQMGVTGAIPKMPELGTTGANLPPVPVFDHDWYKMPPGSTGQTMLTGQPSVPTAPLDVEALLTGGVSTGQVQPVTTYDWGIPTQQFGARPPVKDDDWNYQYGQRPAGAPGGSSW